MSTVRQLINFADDDWVAQLLETFDRDGVAVLCNVFAADECADLMDRIITNMERLTPGLDRADPQSWHSSQCLPRIHGGLYQCVLSNLQAVWDARGDPRILQIFSAIYGHLRKTQVDDFIVSGDGINIKPPFQGPYHTAKTKDWAHLDQTNGSMYDCVQGQLVLCDTTAGFRVTRGSHGVWQEVVAATGGPGKSWRKFTEPQCIAAKQICDAAQLEWQTPVIAPAGSVILWTSSTIHSALTQSTSDANSAEVWSGWRGVIYICMRPRSEFTAAQLKKRWLAFMQNRVTNHTSLTLFPKNPMGRYGPAPAAFTQEDGRNLVTSPELIYEILGQPALSPSQQRMAGHP